MDTLEFIDGRYRTPPREVPLISRAFTSASYYAGLVDIVWRASKKAKKGVYGYDEWRASSLEVIRALERAGVRFDIEGIDVLDSVDGPCVFVANHMSTLETFCLPAMIVPYKDVSFVVKESLLTFPVFGHVMRSRDPIAVSRKNPREDLKAVLEGGARRLGAGISMVIFPQTTRMLRFDRASFNSIGIKLARNAGVPVVPIALKTDAWGIGRFLKEFGRIDPSKTAYFSYGKPIRIEGRGGAEHSMVIDFIEAKLRQWSHGEGPPV